MSLPIPTHPDILPPAKVARIIGINKQNINGWIKRGSVAVYGVYGDKWVSLRECRGKAGK